MSVLPFSELAARLLDHGKTDASRHLLHAVGEVLSLRHDGGVVTPIERIGILLRAVLMAVGAAQGRLFVVNIAEGAVACLGADGNLLAPDVSLGTGIAGSVISSGCSRLEPDLRLAADYRPELDAMGLDGVRNLVSVPVFHDGMCIGALHLMDGHGAFTAADAELAAQVAPLIASALAAGTSFIDGVAFPRLRPLSAQKDRSWRLEGVLDPIVALAMDCLNVDWGGIYLHDPESDELVSVAGTGLTGHRIHLPLTTGLHGTVFRQGESLVLADVADDPRYDVTVDRLLGYRVRNTVIVPIPGGDGRPVGVFQVSNRHFQPFDGNDLRRMKAMAAQAGLAVQNWRLYNQVLLVKTNNDAVLHSLPVGVATFGPDGRITFINPSALAILRLEGEKLIGKPLTRLFPSVNAWVLGDVDEVVATGDRRQVKDAELMVGENEWVTVNLTMERMAQDGDAEQDVMLVMEDVTSQHAFRRTVSRYVNDKIAEQLMAAGGTDLDGRGQEVSVLMSDIRSFTSLTERQGPQETVAMLNEYFSYMEDVVSNRDGMVDKYIGDALMALFGAPAGSGYDADNAVTAACDMLMALRMLNLRRATQERPPLAIGVGIATGMVTTGNIGSSKRTSFTAIGDPVNLASRLESLTKSYGVPIIMCEQTRDRLSQGMAARMLDVIRVRGQKRPVRIFEAGATRAAKMGAAWADLVGTYEAAMDAYVEGDFARALDGFGGALKIDPDDLAATRMSERCRRLLEVPPESWDGVWTYT